MEKDGIRIRWLLNIKVFWYSESSFLKPLYFFFNTFVAYYECNG